MMSRDFLMLKIYERQKRGRVGRKIGFKMLEGLCEASVSNLIRYI